MLHDLIVADPVSPAEGGMAKRPRPIVPQERGCGLRHRGSCGCWGGLSWIMAFASRAGRR